MPVSPFRGPVVIQIAHEWFGLGQVSQVEILEGDIEDAIAQLVEARRIFEFVIDDFSYATDPAEAVHRARQLARRLAPGGMLVLNQHYRVQAQQVAESISDLLPSIRLERVRRGVENVLIFRLPRERVIRCERSRSSASIDPEPRSAALQVTVRPESPADQAAVREVSPDTRRVLRPARRVAPGRPSGPGCQALQ